jgi:hypothetical protein
VIEVAVLFALGFTLAHVRLGLSDVLRMLAILAAGSIPSERSAWRSDTSRNRIRLRFRESDLSANGLFLGLLDASGTSSEALQHAAVYFPAYHLNRLALGVLGADRDHAYWGRWQALACFTAIFLSLAMVGYRRDNAGNNEVA